MMEPVAHIVIKPNGKRSVTLATQYDPMASSFWLNGERPEGYEVEPLVRLSDAEARIKELERINAEHCKAVNTYIILNARLEDRAVAAEQEVERLKKRASDFGDKIREAAYHVWPHAEDVGEDADFIILEIGGERDLAEARAEAAEALLKEAGKALDPFAKLGSVISATQQYRMFLQVMVCPFGDNHPNDYRPHLEAARAIHDKIGAQSE